MSRASRRRRRKSPHWSVRLGLGLVVASTVLLMAEGAARLSGIEPAYQPDRIGGWRMLPAQQGAVINGREGHSFRMSTNADGLRTALSRERTPGVPRVAVMGDSIAFGWGADDGDTLVDGILEGFEQRGTGPVEVLNAAQPGYSTTQVARFFFEVVRHYEPDLVVVFLPMHDHNLVLVSDREHLRGGGSGPVSSARVWLATRSRLYEALRRTLFPLADQPFVVARPGEQAPGEPRVPRVSEAERAENLDGIAAELAKWGGTLALGHMPFEGDLTSSEPLPRLGEAFAAEYAEAHGAPLVDLRPCCGPDGGHLVFEYDKGHLTGEGNHLAGRYAAGLLAPLLSLEAGSAER